MVRAGREAPGAIRIRQVLSVLPSALLPPLIRVIREPAGGDPPLLRPVW